MTNYCVKDKDTGIYGSMRYISGHKEGFKRFTTDNVSIHGAPIIDREGIATNISTANFFQLPTVFAPANSDTWEWQMAYRLNANQTGGVLVGCPQDWSSGGVNQLGGPRDGWAMGSPERGLGLEISKTQIVAKLMQPTSPNPTYRQGNPYLTLTANVNNQTDRLYRVKFTKVGNNYTLSVSVDGGAFVQMAQGSTSVGYYSQQSYIGFLSRVVGHAEGRYTTYQAFSGDIDLANSYIKLNGMYWWRNQLELQAEDVVTRALIRRPEMQGEYKLITTEVPYTTPSVGSAYDGSDKFSLWTDDVSLDRAVATAYSTQRLDRWTNGENPRIKLLIQIPNRGIYGKQLNYYADTSTIVWGSYNRSNWEEIGRFSAGNVSMTLKDTTYLHYYIGSNGSHSVGYNDGHGIRFYMHIGPVSFTGYTIKKEWVKTSDLLQP